MLEKDGAGLTFCVCATKGGARRFGVSVFCVCQKQEVGDGVAGDYKLKADNDLYIPKIKARSMRCQVQARSARDSPLPCFSSPDDTATDLVVCLLDSLLEMALLGLNEVPPLENKFV